MILKNVVCFAPNPDLPISRRTSKKAVWWWGRFFCSCYTIQVKYTINNHNINKYINNLINISNLNFFFVFWCFLFNNCNLLPSPWQSGLHWRNEPGLITNQGLSSWKHSSNFFVNVVCREKKHQQPFWWKIVLIIF